MLLVFEVYAWRDGGYPSLKEEEKSYQLNREDTLIDFLRSYLTIPFDGQICEGRDRVNGLWKVDSERNVIENSLFLVPANGESIKISNESLRAIVKAADDKIKRVDQ